MVKIKFCGITCLEDALAAVEAGADLLGFNFYPPSPRSLTAQACEKLVARLENSLNTPKGRVQMVGIFVNLPSSQVRSILNGCGLDLAQFSGDETPEYLQEFTDCGYKALRPAVDETLLQAGSRFPSPHQTPAFLVDAHAPGLYGGSGQTSDWQQARLLAARHAVLLAGGLHAGNVAEAIKTVKPWGVDTASGIETRPGKKDKQKMQEFAAQVHQAALELERENYASNS